MFDRLVKIKFVGDPDFPFKQEICAIFRGEIKKAFDKEIIKQYEEWVAKKQVEKDNEDTV